MAKRWQLSNFGCVLHCMMALRNWNEIEPGARGVIEAATTPSEGQGLRDALRQSFRSLPCDLPEEIRRLLARLR